MAADGSEQPASERLASERLASERLATERPVAAQPRWTREAADSLRDIYDFIAQDRPHTAARTVESILNKVASLCGSPHLGQHYPYLDRDDVQLLTYGHFRIAYRVDNDAELVVLGVFHGLIFLPRR